MQMQIRSCPTEMMQSGIVMGRLRGKGANCDLANLACRAELCGRQFDSVQVFIIFIFEMRENKYLQVLAWHMSYSHTDLASTGRNASYCFVCGNEMNSAKVHHMK